MRTIYLLLIPFLLLACKQADPGQSSADLVIYGGPIYTVDTQQAKVEAVAVKDGLIIYAGPEAGAKALAGSNSQLIDLAGKTMTPGWIESHGHFQGLGKAKMELDLNGTHSYQEMIDRVVGAVAIAQPGEWITGRGWHQSKWDEMPEEMVKGFPTHQALSAISPDNPVFLRHASGHAGIANAKAMELAGVTRDTEYDETGEVIKDASGEPTGIFNEEAESLISHLPVFSPDMQERALDLATEECLRFGITSFHDAGVDTETLNKFSQRNLAGSLGVRMYVLLNGKEDKLLKDWYKKGPQIDPWLTVRAIKCYADGALGSRGALLLEPYSDQEETLGLGDQSKEQVETIAKNALQHGFQVGTHAIGDRANRDILDAYEAAFEAYPEQAGNSRFRIEHAQHLSLEDIPRFAELGVIASMQGIHMASDRPWAIHRLGQQRIEEGAYVWQKLLESGAMIINGTDVPVEPINPIACYYASVTRKTLAGTPEDGYEAGQKMSREQALRTYTLDAAYAAFQENQKGSIEVGKWADFTIFNQDLLTVGESKIQDTQVMYTIIDGEIKYQRP